MHCFHSCCSPAISHWVWDACWRIRIVSHSTINQNYYPIFNHMFLAKLLKNVVVQQLLQYIEACDLLWKLQLGFRKDHSNKTFVLGLFSDVCDTVDIGHVLLLAWTTQFWYQLHSVFCRAQSVIGPLVHVLYRAMWPRSSPLFEPGFIYILMMFSCTWWPYVSKMQTMVPCSIMLSCA